MILAVRVVIHFECRFEQVGGNPKRLNPVGASSLKSGCGQGVFIHQGHAEAAQAVLRYYVIRKRLARLRVLGHAGLPKEWVRRGEQFA